MFFMRRREPPVLRGAAVFACLLGGMFLSPPLGRAAPPESPRADDAVLRAVRYLSSEVLRWQPAEGCYACHHHGDGARALFAARAAGFAPDPQALDASLAFLTQPASWRHNGPDGPFNDLELARIQFAAALGEAVATGAVATGPGVEEGPLFDAAQQLQTAQADSGAFEFVGADALGEPATYGRTLATVLARRTLQRAGSAKFASAIERSGDWLRGNSSRSVLDAAALLWGLEETPENAAQRDRCREITLRGQQPDGGWGPYETAASEPFDTALALLALQTSSGEAERHAVARGRAYLRGQQQADGSWPETTRPTPRESLAQRVSTTAWALLALLPERAN